MATFQMVPKETKTKMELANKAEKEAFKRLSTFVDSGQISQEEAEQVAEHIELLRDMIYLELRPELEKKAEEERIREERAQILRPIYAKPKHVKRRPT